MQPDTEGSRTPRQSSTSRSPSPRPSAPRAGAKRRPGSSPSGGAVAAPPPAAPAAEEAQTAAPKQPRQAKPRAKTAAPAAAAPKKPRTPRTPAAKPVPAAPVEIEEVGPVDAGPVEPEIVEPEVMEPAAVEPEAPEPAEHGTAEPETVEQEAVALAEPEVVAPEVVAPEVAEPEAEEQVEPEEAAPADPAPVDPAPPSTSVVRTSARTPAVRQPSKALKKRPKQTGPSAVSVSGLTKRFGGHAAVDGVDLEVPEGSFFGFVGPNGAGKTTTLAMITGMLRPDSGEVLLHGVDIWRNPVVAKRQLGVLPDRLRLFDRLTGVEFLHHAGALRGLDRDDVISRTADLAIAFGIEHSLDRYVADYSAGMVKKVAIAAAMIHSPRVLVLDEPFESVDPVSSAVITRILEDYVAAGGTVLLSSHSMELIERVCDSVAIIVDGRLLASGPMAEVVDGQTLERRFVELAGGSAAVQGMEWLQSFSE